MKLFICLLFLSSTVVFSQEDIEILSVLSDEISETSGLIFHNEKLITHNDSGNTPQLFEIDTTTYQISRTVTITNVDNIDWEDIAQDAEYIYVGDFGNNVGTRTDLTIHRINKVDYDQSNSVTAEQINFNYEDQLDFTDSGTSDWDAEAFFILNDQIVILTKQWKSNGTDAYLIPNTPGQYVAQKIDSYAIEGLVTGATYNPLSELLFLIGYSSTLGPFTASFESPTIANLFTQEVNRTTLNIGIAQVESIAYADENTYFFTSELFSRTTPTIQLESTLFKFDVKEIIEPEPEPEPEPDPENNEIQIFQQQGYELIEYNLNTNDLLLGRAVYDTSGRQLLYYFGSDIDEDTVDLSTLQSSVYFLTFYFKNRIESIPFYKL